MNPLYWFRGMPVVAFQEFKGNVKSVRFVIMALLTALLVVGGAYGVSGLLQGGPQIPALVVWGHAVVAPDGNHTAVVWVSDPFGGPLTDRSVEFLEPSGPPLVVIGTSRTDARGFASLDVGNRPAVRATSTLGTYTGDADILFPPPGIVENFTASFFSWDLDNDLVFDEWAVHVTDAAGDPAAARVLVNGTEVATTDALGYAAYELPVGISNVTIEVGSDRQTGLHVVTGGGGLPLASGPDTVLLLIAGLSALFISIFAIVVSFDAISKERVQGTMDLLLSRPVSRTGVLLGKFLGSFGAVAVPVVLVELAGIAAITAASGKAPTGSFAAAFIGLSLLLIAFYVLIQLTFSTLAKTSGTAVLFGVLVWLLLNLLYPILTFMLGSAIFAGNPAGQFRFSQAAALGNPSDLYSILLAHAAPGDLFGAIGGTAVEASVAATAAVVWFVLLLALALWTFNRKAAA